MSIENTGQGKRAEDPKIELQPLKQQHEIAQFTPDNDKAGLVRDRLKNNNTFKPTDREVHGQKVNLPPDESETRADMENSLAKVKTNLNKGKSKEELITSLASLKNNIDRYEQEKNESPDFVRVYECACTCFSSISPDNSLTQDSLDYYNLISSSLEPEDRKKLEEEVEGI